MIDIKKLREVAQLATPGPWHQKRYHERICDTLIVTDKSTSPTGSTFIVAQTFGPRLGEAESCADFIATFNPSTVLSLLDTIERYERALQNIQFVCTKGTAIIFSRDTIETCAARAREALNQKEGG